MASEDPLQRIRNLSQGAPHPGGLDRRLEQVAVRPRRGFQSGQRLAHLLFISRSPQGGEALELPLQDRLVLDLEDLEVVGSPAGEKVEPDDAVQSSINPGLLLRRGHLDALHGQTEVDGPRHPPGLFHLLDDGLGPLDEVPGPFGHRLIAPQRIHPSGRARFLLQDQLGIPGNAGGVFRRQGNGFVQGIGVQALRAAPGGGQRFDGRPGDVVQRVLLRERPTARLAMGPQHGRTGVLRVELGHVAGPKDPSRPEFGHLRHEVHADSPKETESWGEPVHLQSGLDARFHVGQAVGDGVGQLELRRCARLLHVVTRNADRVELGHVRRGVGENVADDAHARRRRIDEGVPHHELLQDVVLDGAGEVSARHALFLGRHDVKGHDGQHGSIHGHRDAHPVERNALEQPLHVFYTVDGHAGLAHIARHPGVIAVIAAVGRQVEGHTQSLLAFRQILSVEGIGSLGSAEPRILSNGPRSLGVHAGIRPPQVGRVASHGGFHAGGFLPGWRSVHHDGFDGFRSLSGDVPGALVAPPRQMAVHSRHHGLGQRIHHGRHQGPRMDQSGLFPQEVQRIARPLGRIRQIGHRSLGVRPAGGHGIQSRQHTGCRRGHLADQVVPTAIRTQPA